ncbi:MAG: SDR family oxidoreductase [Candidatus Nanoarchaeia archaeon]|jgi:3-oxoacyl-[acyl-carrier protein] reductase|nr:SDR family oxidoreductase [Candidatus Nanoarchaeia archaeon]|tara:strand:- start:5043 stop:5720 length:678 start_codon:yes stop_codon:yes gene_type:complete
MFKSINLKDKIVLVTGGSRGIGKAIAKSLVDEGCKVIISSQNFPILKATAKELNVDLFKVDLRNLKEIDDLSKYVISNYKNIDILVNNVGVLYVSSLEKMKDENIDEILDVNVKAIFFLTKRLIPHINKGGTIINISSGLGKKGSADLSVYSASKFAVVGLTQSLASELNDIDVVCVCPKVTNTDMITKNYPDMDPNSMDQPEDVADKVLDSIKGKFRTGSAVDV